MLWDLFNGGDVREALIHLLLSLPVFLLSFSVHEAAHAYVAFRCGDPTAKMLGRLTLNPIKHIDPWGFLLMLTAGFGWAKAVPVNPRNFRNYRRDDLLVSLAGITANLLLCLLASICMYGIVFFGIHRFRGAMGGAEALYILNANSIGISMAFALGDTMGYLYYMIVQLAVTNLVLAVFNLFPIPPLDGYHVLNDLVFKQELFAPQRVGQVGFFLLLILSRAGITGQVLNFVIGHVFGGLGTLALQVARVMQLA